MQEMEHPTISRHPTWYREDGTDIILVRLYNKHCYRILTKIQVENTLFKVARNILATHSQIFSDMFNIPQGDHAAASKVPDHLASQHSRCKLSSRFVTSESYHLKHLGVEGQSDQNPIKIPHITAKEFEYLIEAVYNMFVTPL
jgi:hypothetical protein